MRIGLQTWGTLGDVQPMMQLGAALRARGHQVTLVITSIDGQDYSEKGKNLGIDIVQAPETLENHMASFPAKLKQKAKQPMLKVVLEELFFPLVPAMYAAAQQLCASNDLVVGHFLVYPLKLAAQLVGTPHVSLTLWPGIVPGSDEIPLSLPRDLQRKIPFKWELLKWTLDRAIRPGVVQLWKQVGMPPPLHVVPTAWFSERLNLVAASPLLWGTQKGWRSNHRMTGSFEAKASSSVTPLAPALEEFLNNGEPPVWMTFGSMQRISPEKAVEYLIAIARQTGCRAIIQTKVKSYLANPNQDGLYFVDYVDHQQVLPRCRAILHHGGAGTAQAAVRYGLPSAVVAFIPEQMSWGRQLARVGIGAPPAYYREGLQVEEIVSALRVVLDKPEMRQLAQDMSKKLQHEDGLATCVELLEGVLANKAQPAPARPNRLSAAAV